MKMMLINKNVKILAIISLGSFILFNSFLISRGQLKCAADEDLITAYGTSYCQKKPAPSAGGLQCKSNEIFTLVSNVPTCVPKTTSGTLQCKKGYEPQPVRGIDVCVKIEAGTAGPQFTPGTSTLSIPTTVNQGIRLYNTSYTIPCKIIPGIGGECPSEAGGPAQYITRLYQFGLMIVGFAAFASIVYGAVKYILSAGIVSMQGEAKEQIYDAILGLVLLLGAFLILYTINPALVNLRNPTLEPLNLKVLETPGESSELQQITGNSAGATVAGDLCGLRINAQIDVDARANTNTSPLPVDVPQAKCTSDAGYTWNNGCFIKSLVNTSGAKLPAGTQQGTVCKYCKANAAGTEKGFSPFSYVENCQCNPGLENFNGECVKPCLAPLTRTSNGACENLTEAEKKLLSP